MHWRTDHGKLSWTELEILLVELDQSLPYSLRLIIVGFFRELLGSGTLLGFPVLGNPIAGEKTGLYALGYENNGFMLLAPMALIVVGLIIWVQRSRNEALIEEN